jgi:predicted phage terminase large subunit-like protein
LPALRAAAYQTPAGLAYLASNRTYLLPPHLALLDSWLYKLATKEIKRLMVFMPPRHGKSFLCSQYFPAWYIGRFKGRFILTSYEATLAANWGRLARDVLTEYGPEVFGVRVAQDSAASDHWELENAQARFGIMHTAGVGGAITGRGADILAIDDPVKNAEEADSAVYREKAWRWFTSTAYTRLEPDGCVLVVQTRWHHEDLSGRILNELTQVGADDLVREKWYILNLPAITEEDESYEIPGMDPFERKSGEALWPKRFSLQQLRAIRHDIGERSFTALYQQRPSPEKGTTFHRDWFEHRYQEMPTDLIGVVMGVDSAFKDGTSSDYSAIAVWGTDGRRYYLLHIWRGRVLFPDLLEVLRHTYYAFRPDAIVIEDAASGQSAIQTLRRDTNLPVVAVSARGSKVARAEGVSPLFAAGVCLLPESRVEPLLDTWIEEHVAFPRTTHDDMVDSSTYALAYLKAHFSEGGDVTLATTHFNESPIEAMTRRAREQQETAVEEEMLLTRIQRPMTRPDGTVVKVSASRDVTIEKPVEIPEEQFQSEHVARQQEHIRDLLAQLVSDSLNPLR